jgi:hypothetical protein
MTNELIKIGEKMKTSSACERMSDVDKMREHEDKSLER